MPETSWLENHDIIKEKVNGQTRIGTDRENREQGLDTDCINNLERLYLYQYINITYTYIYIVYVYISIL